jgi:hypothetical protein
MATHVKLCIVPFVVLNTSGLGRTARGNCSDPRPEFTIQSGDKWACLGSPRFNLSMLARWHDCLTPQAQHSCSPCPNRSVGWVKLPHCRTLPTRCPGSCIEVVLLFLILIKHATVDTRFVVAPPSRQAKRHFPAQSTISLQSTKVDHTVVASR